MNQAIRPNVKWSQLGQGERGQASPAAIDALAVALTLLLVSGLIGLIVLVQQVSEFWAGVLLGGVGGVVLIIGLLAVGACLGGARLSAEPSQVGTCDRGAH